MTALAMAGRGKELFFLIMSPTILLPFKFPITGIKGLTITEVCVRKRWGLWMLDAVGLALA